MQSEVRQETHLADPLIEMFTDLSLPQHFRRYYRSQIRDNERLRGNFLRLKHAFDIVKGTNSVIVDAGCGFGHNTVWSALLGARHVHAIDSNETKIAVCRAMICRYGVDDRVTAKVAYVEQLPFRDDSIDVVVTFETVEHFADLGVFFREARRVLKPGGRLYIRTSANALCLPWLPLRLHYYRKVDDERFSPQREEILRKAFRSADPATVRDLAKHTRGLAGRDVIVCAKNMIDGHRAPFTALRVAVDPVTGEWAERVLNPFTMARNLRKCGFDAKVLRSRFFVTGSTWTWKALNLALRLVSVTHPVSLAVSPSIELLAVKVT